MQATVDGHLGCIHILVVVSSAATNMGTHVTLRVPTFSSLGYIPRRGIAGSDACVLRDKKFTRQTGWKGCAKQKSGCQDGEVRGCCALGCLQDQMVEKSLEPGRARRWRQSLHVPVQGLGFDSTAMGGTVLMTVSPCQVNIGSARSVESPSKRV